jgi:hypothetical protein
LHNVLISWSNESLSNHSLFSVFRIKFSLLHDDVESCFILLSGNNGARWHFFVNNVAEDIDVSGRVNPNSLNKAHVSDGIEKIFQIFQLDFDNLGLLICNFLQLDHIFEFSMNWILILSCDRGVLESCDELLALV